MAVLRRSRVGVAVKSMSSVILAMMMVLFIGTGAHAAGIGDLFPSGPDFASLGPVTPFVTGGLAILMAIVGILGLIGVVMGGLRVAGGNMADKQMEISRGINQVKTGLLVIVASIAGLGLILILVKILVAIFTPK